MPGSMVKFSAVAATAPTASTWTTFQLPPDFDEPAAYTYVLGYRHSFGYDIHVLTTAGPIEDSVAFTRFEEIISGETSRMQVRIMTVTLIAAPDDMPALPVRCADNPTHPYRYRINFWTGHEHGSIMLDYNLPLASKVAVMSVAGDVVAHTGAHRVAVYGLALFAAPGR